MNSGFSKTSFITRLKTPCGENIFPPVVMYLKVVYVWYFQYALRQTIYKFISQLQC